MLRVENLGRRFESRWIVRHIEFELGVGDVLVIRGANGSGKSTLLRMLAGLLTPTEGKVIRAPGEIRHTVGYAGLDLALYPNLTAKEHLEFAGAMRAVSSNSFALLEKVGLDGAVSRPVGQYSTGMRARAKLALAIQAQPSVLILDEPTASLDEVGRNLVTQIVDEQRARGATVVATNDPSDSRLATHELVLDA